MNASFTIHTANTLVRESSRQIKSLARLSLKGHWIPAVVMVTICSVLPSIPNYLSFLITSPAEGFDVVNFVLSLAAIALTGAATLSMQSYFLKLFRMEEPGFEVLGDGFKYYGKALILGLVQFLFMALSNQGFIIGIFAYMCIFRYILAYFVILDHPEKSPIQALSNSHYLMFGNKLKLMNVLFSFIGWFLLASLACAAAQYILFPGLFQEIRQAAEIMSTHDMNEAAQIINAMDMPNLIASESSILFSVLKTIITAVPFAYAYTALACFYDIASGNLLTQELGLNDSSDPSRFYTTYTIIDEEPSEENSENDNDETDSKL